MSACAAVTDRKPNFHPETIATKDFGGTSAEAYPVVGDLLATVGTCPAQVWTVLAPYKLPLSLELKGGLPRPSPLTAQSTPALVTWTALIAI